MWYACCVHGVQWAQVTFASPVALELQVSAYTVRFCSTDSWQVKGYMDLVYDVPVLLYEWSVCA